MPATDEERTAIRTLEHQVVEINTTLRFFRKLGWTLVGCAVAIVGSALYVAYRAGAIETDLAYIKRDVGEVKTELAGLKKDVGELRADVVGLKSDVVGLRKDMTELKTDFKGQLDRIEKALAQNRPVQRPQ